MFSIIIPSWNNLAYLKLCIESIRKNSSYAHQIIVHLNDGSDGSLAYIQSEQIDYTHSDSNIGICFAVNQAATLAKGDYIVYMNDDMYVCPQWDKHLLDAIRTLPDDNFMFSGTLIEPKDTCNPCVIAHNYGDSLETFREAELLQNFQSHPKNDWAGSAWPPTVVSKAKWHLIGGYSIEFSPGMSSDDDFAMKMWQTGCRVFKGIAKSRIYHFQAKSTGRIEKNDGRKQFLQKWGLNQSSFNKYFLKRGTPYIHPLSAPELSLLKKELKRAKWKTIWHNLS
jgi:hypothetical protein